MSAQTRVNPQTGILEYFDPGFGTDGQFTTIPQNRLDEFSGSFKGGIPSNYAISLAKGSIPEGQVRSIDPTTGISVYTAGNGQTSLPSNPEEVQIGNNIADLDNFINPDTGQIREEFAGGDLPSIDVIRNQDPATLAQTIEALKNREKGRLTGYKGDFTDLSGGSGLEAFQGAVGTREGFVDPFGQKTQIGMQEDLFKDPQSAMVQGTFDEQKYLRDFPDVAAAVLRGDFASGKDHFDAFGSKEQRDSYYKGGTILDLEEIQTNPDEFLDSDAYTLDATTGQFKANLATTATFDDPTKTTSTTFDAEKSFEDVKKEAMIAAKQQGLTDTVQAQSGVVEKEATVQGQLEGLMEQFEDGKIPPFAAGAIRLAEQRLAARGMGASSMAGAAIVQAAMEASTPIAAADAQTYRSMQELNLNNRQQAEVLNAQMTMQLDLTNLNNEQQARVTNTSNRVQSLFRDQAAVNSAKQFNAASEQQNDQFFSSLSNNAAQFKAAQSNAMERYNAGQQNAVEQFNSSLQNTREQFNQKNAILIDQANAVYKRNVNTANTTLRNAENEFNVRNLFNINQTALNNLLQEDRDKVNFARVNSLNDTAFRNQLALTSFSFDKNLETSKDIARGAQRTRIVNNVVGGIVDFVFS